MSPTLISPGDVAPRSIRTVFADASDAYAAVDQLRARGFRIDLEASIAGDLIVSIQTAHARVQEVGAMVAAHDGRLEAPSPGGPRPGVRPGSSGPPTR